MKNGVESMTNKMPSNLLCVSERGEGGRERGREGARESKREREHARARWWGGKGVVEVVGGRVEGGGAERALARKRKRERERERERAGEREKERERERKRV
jgi:hypothetical protein